MSKYLSLLYAYNNFKRASTYSRASLESLLFPKQKAFIRDESKRKVAICSRRSGKSTGVAFDLSNDLKDDKDGDCAYITLTRGTAKKIMYHPLSKINKLHDLGLEGNRTDLIFTNPDNGNQLFMTGASTIDEVEKLRGLKLKKVVIDEAASFRPEVMNYLIDEIVEPTLIDTDGTLSMIGTPSANPTQNNIFYRASKGLEKGWAVHNWTILDNPFIPHAKKWLEDYRTRKGWDLDHPIYQREWCGQWTIDVSSLVYKYNKELNHYDKLPDDNWHYIMGIDLGFDDAFTIAVLAFCYTSRKVYVVDQYKQSGLIPEKMAKEILYYRDLYSPISMVADHGGLGKAICEEFNRRYHLQIKPAEKTKKAAYIELFNGDLIGGAIKIPFGSPLEIEMRVHQWDPDRPGKEDDRTQNDLCDAALYGFRECRHFLGEVPIKGPEKDTPAYHEKVAQAMLEAEIENLEQQEKAEKANKAWGTYGY